MEQRRSQVPVIALQGLAALAPELPGAALVSRFLKSAQAEWEKLKPKAETLEKLQAWKSGSGMFWSQKRIQQTFHNVVSIGLVEEGNLNPPKKMT